MEWARPKVKLGMAAGLLSGLFLGFFMKYIELVSGYKVYRLLLNINFEPVERNINPPEYLEFLIHLMVSILVACVFTMLVKRKAAFSKRLLTAVIVIIPAILLYFPLTSLGSSQVDSISVIGFTLWTIAHLLYACTLAAAAKV